MMTPAQEQQVVDLSNPVTPGLGHGNHPLDRPDLSRNSHHDLAVKRFGLVHLTVAQVRLGHEQVLPHDPFQLTRLEKELE